MLNFANPGLAKQMFQKAVFLWNADDWDKGDLAQWRTICTTLSAFSGREELEDALVLGPKTSAEGVTRRAFFNLLIDEAMGTPAWTADSPKGDIWLYGNPADEGKKFSTAERRVLHAFGKWLLVNDLTDLFDRLTAGWSLGDYKQLVNFNKASSAQGTVRSTLQTGGEIKDDKVRDLGVEGAWKAAWSGVKGPADDLKTTWGNLKKAQDAHQQSHTPEGHEAFVKAIDSARSGPSFIAEDEAIGDLFQFATDHGDVVEYARLSPNWDNDRGWIKENPYKEARDPEKYRFVKNRIDRLADDAATIQAATRSRRTPGEIAQLRELFFRSTDMVDWLANDLDIPWEDAWKHYSQGPALAHLLHKPTNLRQLGVEVERGARSIVSHQPEVIAKWGPHFISILAFLAVGFWVVVLGTGPDAFGYAALFGLAGLIGVELWSHLGLRDPHSHTLRNLTTVIMIVLVLGILARQDQLVNKIGPQTNQEVQNYLHGLGSYH